MVVDRRHFALTCLLIAGVALPATEDTASPPHAADTPKNYWNSFPDSGVDRVVVTIHSAEVANAIFPNLFLENQPPVGPVSITDVNRTERLARAITGANGVAGAELFKHTRTFAQEMGTISFFRNQEKFDVTISNVGFFMGDELNDFHLFYSWPLAKLVNEIALQHGPGLSQEGFNSLSGARSISISQFMEQCDGKWDDERFKTYQQRPADIWQIFPARDQWPER